MPFTYSEAIEDRSEDPEFYERDVPEDYREDDREDDAPDPVVSMAAAMDWAIRRIAG